MSTSDGMNLSNSTPPDRQIQESAAAALSGNSASLQGYEMVQHPITPNNQAQLSDGEQAHEKKQEAGKQSQGQAKSSKSAVEGQIQEKMRDPKADFARELTRMKEMQQRQELPPDEVEKMRKAEPVLIDDGIL